MSPYLRKCVVAHCPCLIPRHLLMCMDHWRMVPAPLRREVLAAWWKFSRNVDPSMRRAAWVDHGQAVARAVEAVSTKLQHKQAALAEKYGDLFDTTDSRDKNEPHGITTTTGRRGQA